MGKLTLRDWAQVAEILASVGVIVSLIVVALSINRSNVLNSEENSNQTYQALREVRQLVVQDRTLLALTLKEKEDLGSLDEIEQALYREWVILHIDEWERLYNRALTSIQRENFQGWDAYFRLWFEKHVTREIWNNIRWRHSGGFMELRDAEIDAWERRRANK